MSEIDPAGPGDAATLNIADIQNAVRVIDFAAEQGAFRGWEVIEQVLLVRNKMNDFLTAVLPKTEGEAEASSPLDEAGDAVS